MQTRQLLNYTVRIGAASTPDGAIYVTSIEEALDAQQEFRTQVIQTQDRLIREELIKLGWTPPDKRPGLCPACIEHMGRYWPPTNNRAAAQADSPT